jgi:hypothetical protein
VLRGALRHRFDSFSAVPITLRFSLDGIRLRPVRTFEFDITLRCLGTSA